MLLMSATDRVATLRVGVGLQGAFSLAPASLFDDGVRDVLKGLHNQDWLLASAIDHDD